MLIQIDFSGLEQAFKVGQRSIYPAIYDGIGELPVGFNTVCIRLDGSERSPLNWSEAIRTGETYRERGFWIMWEIDFKLQDGSLDDEARFMSFQIAIQHFLDHVWTHFSDQTLGIILYRGRFFEGGEAYLKLLGSLLPDRVPIFLFLDLSIIKDPAAYFHLTSQERWGFLRLALKGPCSERFPYALPTLAWGHTASPLGFSNDRLSERLISREIPYAICLPDNLEAALLNHAIDSFGEIPFRMIPEALLTHEWDGVEKLVIFADYLDVRGWRKIRGFEAAGGVVISYPSDGASLPLRQTFLPASPVSSQRIDSES